MGRVSSGGQKCERVITGVAVVFSTTAGFPGKRQVLAGLQGNNGFSTSVKRFQELAIGIPFPNALQWSKKPSGIQCQSHAYFLKLYEIKFGSSGYWNDKDIHLEVVK